MKRTAPQWQLPLYIFFSDDDVAIFNDSSSYTKRSRSLLNLIAKTRKEPLGGPYCTLDTPIETRELVRNVRNRKVFAPVFHAYCKFVVIAACN